MKKIIAYILIFSFGFLFTPKDFFHSCEHNEFYKHISTNSPDLEINQDQDCDICDFTFYDYHLSSNFVKQTKKDFVKPKTELVLSNIHCVLFLKETRGPPVNC